MFKNFKEYKERRKKLIFKSILKPCAAVKSNIALLIPYRNRVAHLNQFIAHFNSLVVPNDCKMDIFIIEQNNDDKFNRGLLLNIGYLLASKRMAYDRYIFHDVDLFPDQNIFDLYFTCLPYNIHFIIPKTEHKYVQENYLGGVVGVSGQTIVKINGFPNNFFGWGGEDDAFYNRLALTGQDVIYRPAFGGYDVPPHDPPTQLEYNTVKQQNVLGDFLQWRFNGINQLAGFFFINIEKSNGFLSSNEIQEKNQNKNIEYFFYQINYLSEYKNTRDRLNEERKEVISSSSKASSKSKSISKSISKSSSKAKTKRCPKGQRRNKKTGLCENK
jgi:hypothetical protein